MPAPSILILINYYIPGYKAGGPIRSVINIVEHLSGVFDFYILTQNRDATETRPYEGIESDIWIEHENSRIFYASSFSFECIREAIRSIRPNVVYLNSFFSTLTIRYLILHRLRLVPATPVVLAPRGEFSSGALQLKARKKRLYLQAALSIGLYDNLLWQASSEHEKKDITSIFPDMVHKVLVVPNMPPVPMKENKLRHVKAPGSANFIFLSRISPKKNLLMILEVLGQLRGDTRLSIVGPISDPDYWEQCKKKILELPHNVKVKYIGPVPHEQVQRILAEHDFFLLPTLGENFGHVILEAMIAGCPVLISDRTPWRELAEKKVGWDLSLNAKSTWVQTLQSCIDMSSVEYQLMAESAQKFALQWIDESGVRERNAELFRIALGQGQGG